MERKVIYRDRQELQSGDLNNSQDFAQASLDRVVRDGIDAGRKYSGFACTKTASTEVTVSEGRAYVGGKVYRRAEDTVVDLFNALPLTTKRRVAIVTWGADQETDVQPRDFLIDVDAGTTEPQSVAMEALRRAEVSTVSGTEAPDPTYPTTDASVIVIAYVLLDTSGVVSIEQWKDTQLPNLGNVDDRAALLEAWRTQVSGQVDTLRTDLSTLADRLPGYALMTDLSKVTKALTDLKNKVFAPTISLFYNTDELLTEGNSQTGHGTYDATVEEGIRFPMAASAYAGAALLDPNNVYVDNNGGFILPAHSDALRLDMTGYDGEERIAQYTFETTELVQKKKTRYRVRYGWRYRWWGQNFWWWRNGYYWGYNRLFGFVGETWNTPVDVEELNDRLPGGARIVNGNILVTRYGRFFVDKVEEAYWDKRTTTSNVSGQQIAQTFLNSQDGWLSQVGLYFSRKAASGDVQVVICETKFGQPDLKAVISQTSLAVADIQVGGESGGAGLPALVETKVALEPTYLKAGKRYAVIIITSGDHYLATTQTDNAVVQGTFFQSTDGAFFAGNLVKDLKLRLYYAKFERTRVAVELAAQSLSGGITDIDVLAEAIVPPATTLEYQVQINGAWVPLADSDDGPDLTGLPNLLPLRAVFTGTTDLMPGLSLGESQVMVSRPKTAFTWVSTQRTLASPANTIVVEVQLEGFNDVNHDCTISLLTGAALAGSEVADTVEDVPAADGTIRRTATFNVTTISDYAVNIVGAAASEVDSFVVSEITDYAQA